MKKLLLIVVLLLIVLYVNADCAASTNSANSPSVQKRGVKQPSKPQIRTSFLNEETQMKAVKKEVKEPEHVFKYGYSIFRHVLVTERLSELKQNCATYNHKYDT